MAGSSAHFYGVPSVIAQYEGYDLPTWGVFQNKHFLRAGDNAEDLRKYLESLGDSVALYSLCLYDTDPENVRKNTEYHYSFAFKLAENGAYAGGVRMAGGYGGDIVMQKIQGIMSERVGKILEDEMSGKKKDSKPSILDELVDLLHDPDRLVTIIAGVKNIFSSGPLPAGISGVEAPMRRAGTIQQPTMPTENDLVRLQNAINILEQRDPKLVEHLEKLAKLAEDEPMLFKGVIGKLDIL
jgi:hypothetical protein